MLHQLAEPIRGCITLKFTNLWRIRLGIFLTFYLTAKFQTCLIEAFADDKLNVDKMTISVFDRIENTVGKREIVGYQHFLLFPQCFPKPSSLGSLKVGIVW